MKIILEMMILKEQKKDLKQLLFRWKQHWWDCLTEIFKKSKKWMQKYLLDPINKIIENISDSVVITAEEIVEYETNDFNDNGNNCYLFKFYTFDNQVISKIGTSTKSIVGRIIQEINTYKKKGFDIYKGVIASVIDCGIYPPEGAESRARAEFIKQYPSFFVKNDRFIGVDIPVEDFNTLINAYLA